MNAERVEPGYGSDPVGLIAGYHFKPGQPGTPIDSHAAAAWLGGAGESRDIEQSRDSEDPEHAGGEFVWLHFNLAHSACERWLKSRLALPEDFFEALRLGSRSTRIERLDDALLAVVNDVIYNFGVGSNDVATMWACADRRLLVSARPKPLRAVDKLRAAVRAGEAFRSPFALVVHLLRDQADVLVQIVRETSANVDRIEDQLLAQRLHGNRAELGTMRRALVRLQRLLAPEPGALFRLLNKAPPWLQEADLQELREATEEFSLVLADLAGLVERIKLLQEELAAAVNEQTNRTLFTLTLVTVLALPINIVAGFFGMNVGGIPFAEHPHGFWVLVALVAGFSALVGRLAFRRRDGH